MKKSLLILAAVAGLIAPLSATPILFTLQSLTGSVNNRSILIQPDRVANPLNLGTNLVPLFDFSIQPVNGQVLTNLEPWGYTITVQGWPRSAHIVVSDSTNIVNVVSLLNTNQFSPLVIYTGSVSNFYAGGVTNIYNNIYNGPVTNIYNSGGASYNVSSNLSVTLVTNLDIAAAYTAWVSNTVYGAATGFMAGNYYPLTGNPSGFQTAGQLATALAPYPLISSLGNAAYGNSNNFLASGASRFDAAQLTNVPAADVTGQLTNNTTGNAATASSATFATTASSLAGTINASQIASGTIADARLSANVAFLNGNQTYTASNSYTKTTILTNAPTSPIQLVQSYLTTTGIVGTAPSNSVLVQINVGGVTNVGSIDFGNMGEQNYGVPGTSTRDDLMGWSFYGLDDPSGLGIQYPLLVLTGYGDVIMPGNGSVFNNAGSFSFNNGNVTGNTEGDMVAQSFTATSGITNIGQYWGAIGGATWPLGQLFLTGSFFGTMHITFQDGQMLQETYWDTNQTPLNAGSLTNLQASKLVGVATNNTTGSAANVTATVLTNAVAAIGPVSSTSGFTGNGIGLTNLVTAPSPGSTNILAETANGATVPLAFSGFGGTLSGNGGNITNLQPAGLRVVNVKSFGALGNGLNDDSSAIQSAINSITNTGGTVYFPLGVYVVSTNWTQAAWSTNWALLHGPVRDIATNGLITIAFVGDTPPASLDGSVLPKTNSCSTIYVNQGGTNSNFGLFGDSGPTNDAGSAFNAVHYYFNNLLFCTSNNPQVNILNMDLTGAMTVNNCSFSVFATLANEIQPSSAHATAIVYPGFGNYTEAATHNVQIFGYNTGMQTSEHAVLDDDKIYSCSYGINIAYGLHGLTANYICMQNDLTNIIATGATAISIQQLSIEHTYGSPSWITTANQCDLYDPQGNLSGTLGFAIAYDPTYGAHYFIQNGGSCLSYNDLNGQTGWYFGDRGGTYNNTQSLSQNMYQQTAGAGNQYAIVTTLPVVQEILAGGPGTTTNIGFRWQAGTSSPLSLNYFFNVEATQGVITSYGKNSGINSSANTNTIPVVATGCTNNTLVDYVCSVTAGMSLAVKDSNGNQFLAPVLGDTFPLKPGWRFTGTGVTGICVAK